MTSKLIDMIDLQTKNNLEQAMGQEKVDALEKALVNYRDAAAKLEPYRQQKNINLILLTCDEINKAESGLQTLLNEKNVFLKNPDFPKQVGYSRLFSNISKLVQLSQPLP